MIRDLLKTRLKVTSVFIAIWPHPHAFKHQAIQLLTAAQRLDPAVSIELGRNQCCATPEDCTMIDVHVKVRDKYRS